ncbi:class I SAM-dependent methyltransferase [Halobacterium noricense]|uniref:class I SAM-dependent methyltransferase n=1 Tax=Halobacterium noricense TaxID=223182 RepID=UPI001E50664B|nr:class I SAM-dependent methyltransferase [Halobacterium noricense]UHH26269.1 class I SAM-dependent methyltransferase [Halobacterium noricense]
MTDTTDIHHTYDRIAEHFSKTREYPWPEIETFLADRTGSVAVDVGCGNGRHTELLAECADRAVGVDASRGLLDEARERAADHDFDAALVAGDAERLPLAADVADLAVYIATIHHLPDRDARVASLDELARVLTADGDALVSAWSTTHDKFDREARNPSESRTAEGSEISVEGFDTTVDWTLPGGETVPRFYHVYSPEEFRADLAASSLAVAETFTASGNCYGVVHGEE